jgi:hypothetical protein
VLPVDGALLIQQRFKRLGIALAID